MSKSVKSMTPMDILDRGLTEIVNLVYVRNADEKRVRFSYLHNGDPIPVFDLLFQDKEQTPSEAAIDETSSLGKIIHCYLVLATPPDKCYRTMLANGQVGETLLQTALRLDQEAGNVH